MQVKAAPILLTSDNGKRANDILRKCVHCGFCNATCPTFKLLGDERDGPRGRIYLIKELLESNRPNESVGFHLDRCLTCRNCETTCPSGVEYGELLEFGRDYLKQRGRRFSLLGWFLLNILPNRLLFRTFVFLGRLTRFALPSYLRDALVKPVRAPKVQSSANASVVLLQGCVQQVLTPDVVAHLGSLLERLGVGFRIASNESCCGSLHLHYGSLEHARRYMSRLVEAVDRDENETVISTASGCGLTVKEYVRHLPDHEESLSFSANTQDVSEFLSRFDFAKLDNVDRVAFHPPCTLQHGQSVNGVVEKVLRSAGYDVVDVRDSHLCCGSAGTYSLTQPEISNALRDDKLNALVAHKPDVIVTANIGCQMHLAVKSEIPVMHWIQLLDVCPSQLRDGASQAID